VAQEDQLQEKLIADRRGRQADAPFSSGRGGAGNISDSRSRSRSAIRAESPRTREDSRTRTSTNARTSSGRGGYGNVVPERDEDLLKLAQEQLHENNVIRDYEAREAGGG
jgi:hypothetical protein